ncbi:uncharacterized protein LOC123540200 [Mercenaria mercenaria]|uniref:uncharacterized protein LOC123540200 n=1 Tax=Mercenaria mercenaria TaxID=6596 RepID=UPI00234F4F3E|nr:uncharacterized protein LOC123540200 [Mercenaria mercenaria]
MFKALDRVRYDTLRLNKKEKPPPSPFQVKSLTDLACISLNWFPNLLDDGVGILPIHLVPKLLKIAINNDQAWAVSTIIANWPLETLRFADILTEEEAEVFEEDMGAVCFYVFEGITSRTKNCRLKCLDFTDIKLNGMFCKLIIQIWPLLSLKKSQLKPKKLAKTVAQVAGVDQIKLTYEIIPKILAERLEHDVIITSDRIVLPRGQRMEVKIDGAHFTTNNMFFMDYMISNCLRSITPVFVTVSNIHIKSELVEGDVITDSLAPFLVLKGQDTGLLDGLSLRQLEEGILHIISPDIMKFTNLHSLDIQDCNLYLQEGITRSRTVTRSRLCNMLSSFHHLHRLDISFNFLIGCLGELLDALKMPLDYLSVRGCDLNEMDLNNLAKSKHAPHLRELNISKLCSFSIYESDRIAPMSILRTMKHFPKMTLLNLSQNHLPDSGVKELCEILTNNLVCLKGLDMSGNIMQFESQLELAKACAEIPKMQWVRLTCMNNVLNEGILMDNNQIGAMYEKLLDVMKSRGRDDICVDVVRLSVAILVDLIDFLE